MAQSVPTTNFGFQDFFSTTLSSAITSSDTTIPLAAAPTPTEGILVIEPDSSSNREIIMYTSVSGSNVVCGSTDDRGISGTTARAHSSGVTVKMNTAADMFEALKSGAGFAAGIPVQTVNAVSAALATGTTTVPLDDTIPQNTEGDQYMTLTITPKSATNILLIYVKAFLSTSTAGHIIGALFQDTTANALAATDQYNDTNTGVRELHILHTMTAATTSSTTFKFRAGKDAAGTTTFNGSGGARLFGAINKSGMFILEYKA